ncbi:MAG: class A beta-lactamase-related serine hydrolase [Chitinophagaceae bacterium]|nr:MAG: class A beta-lactamase-related serine hydrolase [Chitinophagaceae bacterium]
MKLKILLGLLLSFNLTFGQNQQITRLDGSKISAVEIDKTINLLMDKANVQGLSMSILNKNQQAYIKTYGFKNKEKNEFIDTSTVLYAASFSKAVFGYLTMKLVQEKTIDLDKPLYKYLSKPISEYEYFSDLKSDDRWKLMTARMCLSHTTGFPNVRWIHPTTGVQDTIGVMKIYFTPGKKYAYSGEGIKLLQLVIEEITKKNVEELAIEKVFKPIGMAKTGYIWYDRFDDNFATGHLADNTLNPRKKRTTPVAGASLVTTISDYTRFIEYLMQQKGLDKQIFKEMITPQIEIHSKTQFPPITEETTTENRAINLSYGLGWGLLKCKYGRAFFKGGHDDAWRNYNINFIDKGISIIIITNSANGEFIFKELLETLIGDTFTPWKWEGYFPIDYKK